MRDAKLQSIETKVERCKYNHQWGVRDTADVKGQLYCSKCDALPKAKEMRAAESIVHLRTLLNPGDTVYTVLRHVSRSGMSRNIDLYAMIDGQPLWISSYVGHAIGSPQSEKNWRASQGLTVGGCGMDMGFHLVESLSHVLFPEYKCLGQRDGDKPRCPSNYHVNHRDRVRCNGVGTGDDWTPCYPSSTLRQQTKVKGITVEGRYAFVVRVPRIGDDGVETICPTCNGEGYRPNPEGKERWDLVHTDGYALNHKWL